jgi:hypothetical protein
MVSNIFKNTKSRLIDAASQDQPAIGDTVETVREFPIGATSQGLVNDAAQPPDPPHLLSSKVHTQLGQNLLLHHTSMWSYV